MLNMYIGDLKVHDSVNATDLWLQTPISGLESPENRMNIYARTGEDGAVVSSTFYGGRTVTLNGFIKGDTNLEYETNRIAFIQACAQQKDEFGYPTPTRVTLTTLANTTFYFDAYIRKPEMDYREINYCNYQLEMVCADPYIYSSTGTSTVINRAIAGGAIVPFIVPVTLGASSGGTGTAVNNGNGTAFPIITLTGQLTSPYIANTTTGKIIQLNYTLDTGNTIVIDMHEKTILLNGASSLLSTKTVDSEWWALAAGSNNIQLSTGSTADAGYITIAYNDAYLGV